MDTNQLSAVRLQLETRRGEIQSDLDRIGVELESIGIEQGQEHGGTGNHLADDGSSVMEQERIGTIAEDMQDVLSQINGALGRLDAGTYGVCLRCEKAINPDRLEAFPYVEYCIDCQTILEREQHLYGDSPRVN